MKPKLYNKIYAAWVKLNNEQSEYLMQVLDKEGDWESLCVGFCIGKGATVDEAADFYKKMIEQGEYF